MDRISFPGIVKEMDKRYEILKQSRIFASGIF